MAALVERRPVEPKPLIDSTITFANLIIAVSVFVAVLAVALYVNDDYGEVEAIKFIHNSTIMNLNPRYLRIIAYMDRLEMYARRTNGDITHLIIIILCCLLIIAFFLDPERPSREYLTPFFPNTIITFVAILFALGLDRFSVFYFLPHSQPEFSHWAWMSIFIMIEGGTRAILWLFVKILGSLNQWRISLFQRARMFVRMRG